MLQTCWCMGAGEMSLGEGREFESSVEQCRTMSDSQDNFKAPTIRRFQVFIQGSPMIDCTIRIIIGDVRQIFR